VFEMAYHLEKKQKEIAELLKSLTLVEKRTNIFILDVTGKSKKYIFDFRANNLKIYIKNGNLAKYKVYSELIRDIDLEWLKIYVIKHLK
jgi:hypothetical protein